ncbi:MAG TPA: hypothetical protein VNO30_22325 [Kofleriaceae bacterium]|nr:hypothetical protein [Kofleriaceae bacterium]
MSKRDQDRELSRRALVKWSLAAGAALGLGRGRIAEVLERTAGSGVAQAAGDLPTKRSVHIRAVTGGLAWFQLLWPHNDIADAAATNATFPYHRPGQHQRVAGTDRPLTIGPDTPFAALPARRQITAYMAGENETHETQPDSITQSLGGKSMFAIAAALQAQAPAVVPVIAVGDSKLGSAPGAPAAAVVPTGDDIVGLFNSAASRAGGLLATGAHADLYRAQFATLAALNRAAERPTTKVPYATARSAAGFLGTNLAARLQITAADLAAYGIDGTTRADIAALGRALIVTAKAFAMNLTSSVIVPGPRDDPHPAFANLPATTAVAGSLKRVLDGFMNHLAGLTDDPTGRPLSEELVLTIDGDTPKTPLSRQNWLDDTPANSNWMFVLGGGMLRTGWFGGVTRTGAVTGFDPATGQERSYQGDAQAEAACTAVAYAIARGDTRRVQDFSRVDISGLVAP